MNKNIFITTVLILLVIPRITFAAWWNPTSWRIWNLFRKDTPTAEVISKQQELAVPANHNSTAINIKPVQDIPASKKVPTPKPKDNNSVPTANTKPISTLVIPTQQKVVEPLKIPLPPEPVKLIISRIKTDSSISSAEVSWETNIVSESKIILNGKSYMSEGGIGTNHYVTLDRLASDSSYNGTITAIADNMWAHEDVSFKTEHAKLQITYRSSKPCNNGTCMIYWETNTKSDGVVKVYDTNSGILMQTIASQMQNSTTHKVEFELPNKSSGYTFKIEANNDADSVEATVDVNNASA